MRIFTVLLGLVLATGCSSFFKRGPSSANSQKPKHYIMTLHGVRGTETAFGDFHSLIKEHLEKIDPSFEVVPINIVYPKGFPGFTAKDAAIAINQKLDAAIPNLDPADKISVLAYSMGGQVGMTWYFNSLQDPAHKKYPLQVTKFFSLGAAYWGSKEAAMGVSVDNIIGQADVVQMTKNWLDTQPDYLTAFISKDDLAALAEKQRPLIEKIRDSLRSQFANFGDFYNERFLNLSKISYAELVNLAVASDESVENRIANLNFKNNTRWISLSSLVKCMETDITSDEPGCQSFQNDYFKDLQLNVFGKYTFGYSRRETDNSVITPSANANFIYAFETDANYEAGALTEAADFHYSIPEGKSRFILAEGLHATVIPAQYYAKAEKTLSKAGAAWTNLADDVALIYKSDCENPSEGKCKHPAYKFIVQEFADCDISACDQAQVDKIIKPLFVPSDATAQQTLKSELHGFVLELNLRLPKGYDMSGITHKTIFNNAIQAKFADREAHLIKLENSNYDVILARPNELAGLVLNKVTKYGGQDQLRVAMMGLVVPKAGKPFSATELETGVPVEFSVNLPGLKSRRVQAVVRPYYTTYTDLVMAK